jgi:hypothetical protein
METMSRVLQLVKRAGKNPMLSAQPSEPASRPTLEPMTKPEAMTLLNRILGSYPSQPISEVLAAEMMALLLEYPAWAGEQAVRAHLRSKKWLPKISQLAKALEEQVRVARDAAAWDAATRVSDAARLAAPPKPPRPTYDELKAHYGPNWGIVNPDKTAKRQPTKQEALDRLYAEFGRAMVDAVPDAPPRERSVGEIRDDLAGEPRKPQAEPADNADDPLHERWAAE